VVKREDGPLLVVDGDLFTHRAYHAVPKTVRAVGGRPAGAIVGFANSLLRLYETEQPRAVVVGWDTLDHPTYRHIAYPAYQSGRVFDPELIEQLEVLPGFVEACGFVSARGAGFEADDFIAAAVTREEAKNGRAVLASGDRDMFQLASARTTILQPQRGGGMARIGPAEVRERYGVEPQQVPDFIALRGDPSDKLPGARNVGAQTAASLLRKYGTLDAILEAGRFPGQANDLRLFKRIATMDPSAPVPTIADHRPTWSRAAKIAREWDLARLADRLDGMEKASGASQ
jgi:DNA polymerase-1